ncbi:hypothetical protein NEOLEDRAFT_896065 [Neolentinus lepideus HHB14362 ss-1]|uniref:Uncharacterized protein n=1 Tax=Neolentinus lepideus HHB14362 ss-1 TaxID=1314782 RepID=A0A165NQR5_9AGAM|nr:hypothetical protein NEOLEDRAFT_896065 [Neolentinus lepideus HHB14362 ss-1]
MADPRRRVPWSTVYEPKYHPTSCSRLLYKPQSLTGQQATCASQAHHSQTRSSDPEGVRRAPSTGPTQAMWAGPARTGSHRGRDRNCCKQSRTLSLLKVRWRLRSRHLSQPSRHRYLSALFLGCLIDPALVSLSHNGSHRNMGYSTSTSSPSAAGPSLVETAHTPTSLNPAQLQYPATATSPPAKRGRGRPKGTKNGPNTKNVGRPRKDGKPPQRRIHPHQGAGPSDRHNEGNAHSIVPPNPSELRGLRWQHTNPETYSASLAAVSCSTTAPPAPEEGNDDLPPRAGQVPTLHPRTKSGSASCPTILSQISRTPNPPSSPSQIETSTYRWVSMPTRASGFTIPPYPRHESQYYLVPLRGHPDNGEAASSSSEVRQKSTKARSCVWGGGVL